jgi:tetratricopeptide (TPR) repeat protein
MSPRPLPPAAPDPAEAFAPALALARSGACDAAVDAVRRVLRAGDPHPQRTTAAATTLAAIARHAGESGDAGAALRAIEAALDAAPRWPDLHVQRARLLLARPARELSDRAAARRALQTALRLHPGYVAARFELAMLDATEGRLGESLDTLRAMAGEHRGREAATFEQGLERLRHAEWDEAAALLAKALELSGPADALESARQCLERGEPERALQLVRAALPACRNWPDAQLLMAAAELQLGHLEDAVDSCVRALELNPEFHAARLQLARALQALGQTAQAADQAGFVLQCDPQHPEALALQAGSRPGVRVTARVARGRRTG